MTALLVALGAAVGAPLRYLTDRMLHRCLGPHFPWGTLTVNVVGSGTLGFITGASTLVSALVGTGLCGALTTYSTFGYETVRLIEGRAYFRAGMNVTLNVVAGIGAATLGHALA